MKSKLFALLLGTLTAASAVAAPALVLTPPSGWDGGYSIKIVGYESFTAGIALGSNNFGVVRVTSILDGSGTNTIWADGQGGAEIVGVFSGISVTQIIPGFFSTVISTSGTASFFINPFGSFASAGGFAQGSGGYAAAGSGCAVNLNCYNGISNVVGGGSFLDLMWVPGVLDSLTNTTDTVAGVFTGLTTPFTGFASGFLSVTGGPYQSLFDTDGFSFLNNAPADMRASNNFCTTGQTGCPTAGNWFLKLDDPITGRMRVPEPASLSLIALGLLGMAAYRRRA